MRTFLGFPNDAIGKVVSLTKYDTVEATVDSIQSKLRAIGMIEFIGSNRLTVKEAKELVTNYEWNLTPDSLVYMSNDGSLTHTAPAIPRLLVGVALSPSTIFLNLQYQH